MFCFNLLGAPASRACIKYWHVVCSHSTIMHRNRVNILSPSLAPAAAASFRISMLVFLLGTASLLIPVVLTKGILPTEVLFTSFTEFIFDDLVLKPNTAGREATLVYLIMYAMQLNMAVQAWPSFPKKLNQSPTRRPAT